MLLDVTGLKAGYGLVPVLRDITLQVGASEIIAVLGANGAGKSTLNRILSGRLISPNKKHALVAGWIADLGVRIGKQDDAISTLSGGNQQRVAIAKWLATDPKVLILDAPTVGVDVGARAGIFEIVARLADAGLAIILISDEVPEVYFNADRIIHMEKGRIAGWHDPRTTTLKGLEAAIYA